MKEVTAATTDIEQGISRRNARGEQLRRLRMRGHLLYLSTTTSGVKLPHGTAVFPDRVLAPTVVADHGRLAITKNADAINSPRQSSGFASIWRLVCRNTLGANPPTRGGSE